MPRYIRYEVIAPCGKTTGIFTAVFCLTTLLDNSNLGDSRRDRLHNPKYDRVLQSWKDRFSWIKDPEVSGEYWFKPEGDIVFQQFTLSILSKALLKGSQVVRVEIEANDDPIYEDVHQVCFEVKQAKPFQLTNML